jgi:hypothetical protein
VGASLQLLHFLAKFVPAVHCSLTAKEFFLVSVISRIVLQDIFLSCCSPCSRPSVGTVLASVNSPCISLITYLCRFYYYGSTRGQKKTTASQKEGEEGGGGGGLTPRPLLPSQRVLGGDTRLGPSPTPPPKVCQQRCCGSGIFWGLPDPLLVIGMDPYPDADPHKGVERTEIMV